jgi:ABC-type multidrug transport system fused ATPase/permease subunit
MVRFYDPSAGQILLDGVDLRELTKSEIRAHVGIVLQEDHYVRGTIRDNLTQVRTGVTEDDQWSALNEVGLGAFVAEVGLDHPANSLSKGQRQRLAIARAFLKDPRVLILDEPTAAVDPLAVREIDASLRRVCEGRTTLLISHNMSLVLEAKRIFVLEDGRLVQSGTHRELFDQEGAYRRIMQAYIETLKIEKLEARSPRGPIPVHVRPEGPILRSEESRLGEGRSGHAEGEALPPGTSSMSEAPIPMIDARGER